MRRSRSSAVVLLAVLLAAPADAPAQTTPTVEGGAFLLLPVGGRATALGQASVASGGTTEAIYWNPAGLDVVKKPEAAIHYYSAFFGTGTALAVAVPAQGLGTFAASIYLVDYGELDLVLGPNQPPIGRIVPRNVALSAAFATDIAFGVSAGIAYKLVQFRVDCSGDCSGVPVAVGTTHALDLGVRYPLRGVPVTVGAAVRNLGFKLQVNNQAQADPLPTRLAVGFEAEIARPPAGVEGLDVRVLVDLLATVGRSNGSLAPLFGIEAGVGDLVRLRAGYAFIDGQARGPSLGLGVHGGRFSVDLAKTFYSADEIGEREPVHLSLRIAL